MRPRNNLEIDLTEDEDRTVVDIIVDEDGPVPAGPALDADIVNEDVEEDDKLPAHARVNLDGSVTLPLQHPRTVRSQKDGKIRERLFDALLLYRLTGADLNAIMAASDETSAMVALARSMRLNQAVANGLYTKLDAADAIYSSMVISHFLPSGRKTGKRGSA